MSVISNYIAVENKAFSSLDGLRNHINSCHMPKRFECEMCTYKSSQGGHLQRNRRMVHGAASQTLNKWQQEQ